MRKILAATFVSLDGVMQAPGGPKEDTDGGFALGGWPLKDPSIGLDTLIAAFLVSLLISIVAAVVALVRKLTPGI